MQHPVLEKLYLLLSRIFEREADEDLLESLREVRGRAPGLDELREASRCRLVDLAADYASLFLGVKRLPHPSESGYKKGLLYQEYSETAELEYLEEGLGLSESFKEPADHVAAELHFAAVLYARGSEKAAGWAERLRSWLPKLAEAVEKNAETPLYRGAAKILYWLMREKLPEELGAIERLPAARPTVLRELSREEVEKLRRRLTETRVCYVPTNLAGMGLAEIPQKVYARGRRIVRITPIRLDGESVYEIRARGKRFSRPPRSLPAPYEAAYKTRVYSPTRVRYPLKRVDWSPGNRNPQNRGKSKFVRISWDEALGLIAEELRRIAREHGPTSIAVMGDGLGHSTWRTLHSYVHALCEPLGGCIHVQRNPDSWEGYYWGAKHVWGMDLYRGHQYQDDIYEDVLENTEMIICTGCDPETTSWAFWSQSGTVTMKWLREAGIKLVFISPDLNHTAAIWADKWIPIRPNTDAALYFAIAYLWLQWGTYDKKFLETHTVGFEEFKKYVLGEEDGQPKTPEWAEKITGIPVETIKALARAWARKKTSIGIHYGGPKIRGPYSTEPARLEALLLAMQGLGAPGRHQVKIPAESTWPRRKPEKPGSWPDPVPGVPGWPDLHPSTMPRNPYVSYVREAHEPLIPKTLLPEAILEAPLRWRGSAAIEAPREDQFREYRFPPEERGRGLKALINENGSWLTSWNGGYRMIEALRSPGLELVVVVAPWFENDALYADIVLPAATPFENEDFAVRMSSVPPVTAVWIDKCVEPVGEAKSDYDIFRELLLKLGDESLPSFEEFARSRFELSALARYASWEELKEKKLLVVPAPSPDEWERIKSRLGVKPGLRLFYENPERYPLDTPTGKIEFYSEKLAEEFPGDEERPPVPHYIPYGETHQESLEHPRARKYPLLLVSNHPRWRVHTQGDDSPWLAELPASKIRGPDGYYYEPVWINPVDAEARGIKHGDIVMIYNDRGAVLAGAYVTERVPPGVVRMDHGARVDVVGEKLDRGGAINLIAPRKTISRNCPGMVVSGYLVEVEKTSLEQLRSLLGRRERGEDY